MTKVRHCTFERSAHRPENDSKLAAKVIKSVQIGKIQTSCDVTSNLGTDFRPMGSLYHDAAFHIPSFFYFQLFLMASSLKISQVPHFLKIIFLYLICLLIEFCT